MGTKLNNGQFLSYSQSNIKNYGLREYYIPTLGITQDQRHGRGRGLVPCVCVCGSIKIKIMILIDTHLK